MSTMKYLSLIIFVFCTACSSVKQQTLYEQIGGQQTIAEIVDNFIGEIEFNAVMFEYFKDSDIDRFRSKLNEHLCVLTNGPCEYTGDSMVDVHTGMNISEADFNLGVDLFINAMNKASIPTESVYRKVNNTGFLNPVSMKMRFHFRIVSACFND